MSWESTALYYRLFNESVRDRLGGLHSAKLLLWSFDFAEIESLQTAGDWETAGHALEDAARRLEAGGAECLAICANTMHLVADAVQDAVSIPLVHIADATASALRDDGIRQPLLLATRYTMEQDFYTGRLRDRHGIDVRTPNRDDRTIVHDIIYRELCRGIVRDESRGRYLDIVDKGRAAGCDGLILGCTEVGMLLQQGNTALPVYDTAEIHVRAILEFALLED